MKRFLLGTVCAATFAIIASPAFCQTAEAETQATDNAGAPDATTVVVTATHRKSKLQDVPLSVTSISQKELTSRGVVGYDGLAQMTPGVVLNRQSANWNNFTARGVATNGYGAGLQSTVAIYLDEVPISTIGNTVVVDPNLYDLDHVEFLRGPQGTLFGSGSMAGALKIITKSPDVDHFAASALVDIGEMSTNSLRQRYNAMINVPLIPGKLALRAVGFYRNEDGYVDNLGTGIKHANSLVDSGGRVNLLWTPTDKLSVKFLYSREDSNPADSSMTTPSLGTYKKYSNEPDLFQAKVIMYNNTIDYQFDWGHFTNSINYFDFDQKFVVDLGNNWNYAIAFGLDAYGYDKKVVEEARLVSNPGKFEWVLGSFYMGRHYNVDYFYRSSLDFLATHHLTGLAAGDDHYIRLYTLAKSHEQAVYADGTYHFNDKVWATVGLRQTSSDARADTLAGGYGNGTNYYALAFGGGPGVINTIPYTYARGVTAKGEGLSYRASLSFKPSNAMTTYAQVSTGFRAPLVNARAGAASLTDPTDIIIPYSAKSDDIKNFEIGLKGHWLNNRLFANLAIYHIDWTDIQVQANRVSDSVQFATNIGGAVSKGVEFDVTYSPVKGLWLGFNGALNNSKVTKLSDAEAAISGTVLGQRLSSPQEQGSAYINYDFDITPSAKAHASLVASHVGSFPSEFPNVPGHPTQHNPTYDSTQSYNIVNGTFAVAFNRVTVGLYGENLGDTKAVTYVHPEMFLASRYSRVAPRTIGVRMSTDF